MSGENALLDGVTVLKGVLCLRPKAQQLEKNRWKRNPANNRFSVA
jgi:hypothetical protein